jgi:hypothetical protein
MSMLARNWIDTSLVVGATLLSSVTGTTFDEAIFSGNELVVLRTGHWGDLILRVDAGTFANGKRRTGVRGGRSVLPPLWPWVLEGKGAFSNFWLMPLELLSLDPCVTRNAFLQLIKEITIV